jgi:hypothetical protein
MSDFKRISFDARSRMLLQPLAHFFLLGTIKPHS